jgi:signal recognition particle receptor subunit beta
MAFINHVTKTIAIKIVYYGPGLSGKTTNLRYIYYKLDPASRGDLVCLETDTERTFFFDLLPIKAGQIGEYKIHFQLMTVPGQVFYEASRKNVVKGVDGIVFVADSQIPLLDANLENFDGMRKNLLEHNINLDNLPLVFQYNKRDLDNLIPVETFNNLLNPRGLPYLETVAINGVGVIETVKAISKLTIPQVKEELLGEVKEEDEKEEVKAKEEEKKVKEEEKKIVEIPKKEEIEFLSAKKIPPIKYTKIKTKSQKDIEKEIEKLTEEFTGKMK